MKRVVPLIPLVLSTPLAAQTPARPAPRTPSVIGRVVTPPPAVYVPPAVAHAPAGTTAAGTDGCTIRDITKLGRNPTPGELRCRYAARGPGRFGLLSYLDVPVYQPRTPQPGTHIVGVPGMPHPALGESYEQWEWRVLRTTYGPSARTVHRETA